MLYGKCNNNAVYVVGYATDIIKSFGWYVIEEKEGSQKKIEVTTKFEMKVK